MAYGTAKKSAFTGSAATIKNEKIATAIGYVEGAVQSAETLAGLKYSYAFICGGIFIISVLVVLKYPLSKGRHDEVLKGIEDKKQGKSIDMNEFKDLI